ncbi:5-formyltetrahydrofolate cyclo-ligase [Nonlabens marinus S1-08]|uniref:5-formyltetrahydrofolate cyclo-ligase n=2 Tax=Nonlabens TaxID=363408 RepID=W8VZF5_9FLAO|nr:5-formyltetrahydrofolate cyclo-ligase [Nonlabens marinus S1-08]
MSNEEVHGLSLQIANNVLKLDIWDQSLFHLFLPIQTKNEVRTEYILQVIQGRDKNVALSRSDFETFELRHFLLTDQTTIKVNEYGIPEPKGDDFEIKDEDLDVVFIPLLAVDKYGNRIGYGKGFYDRFLAKCRPNTIKVGISFFEPLNFTITTNDTDMPLDQLVTPKGVVKFRSP